MRPSELLARRRAMGLSQAALAERLGVAANTVARWERGELRIAKPRMLDLALRAVEASERQALLGPAGCWPRPGGRRQDGGGGPGEGPRSALEGRETALSEGGGMNAHERRRKRLLKAIEACQEKLDRLDPGGYRRERDYRRLVTYYRNRIAWGLKLLEGRDEPWWRQSNPNTGEAEMRCPVCHKRRVARMDTVLGGRR